MWELFVEYKNENDEISINGFQDFCKKTIGEVKHYFHKSTHESFNDVVRVIKDEVFKSKLNLYKQGKIHHQKICREASERGIDLAKTPLNIGKTNKNQFIVEDGKLSIKDEFLKKKSHTAKLLISKKAPNSIYVLNIEGTNIYKIGTSQNTNRRIKDICASIPFHVDIIHVQKVMFAYELEQSIHEQIDHLHVKNEWFKIKDINRIINIIKNA